MIGTPVGDGQKSVVGAGRAGHVGRSSGPVLGSRPPRPVSHGEAVDVDPFAVEDQMSAHPPELVEVLSGAEGRADGGQWLGGHDPLEAQLGMQPVAVVVPKFVPKRWFHDPDRDSGRQHDVP